jgi:hypothetical protein
LAQVTRNPHLQLTQAIEDEALRAVQRHLRREGKRLAEFGLPTPPEVAPEDDLRRYIHEELAYDRQALDVEWRAGEQRLNAGQREIWDAVQAAMAEWRAHPNGFPADEPLRGRVFFVDGPAGTGKTFVYRMLLASVRSRGGIALAVASSGIAALLLPGGRTAHSRLKLPLNPEASSTCKCAAACLCVRTTRISDRLCRACVQHTPRHASRDAASASRADRVG